MFKNDLRKLLQPFTKKLTHSRDLENNVFLLFVVCLLRIVKNIRQHNITKKNINSSQKLPFQQTHTHIHCDT